VASGYKQVSGIGSTESHAPVIDDVSFGIILIEIIVCNLKAKIIDIETLFFYGDYEERIFMEIQSGMEVGNGICLDLKIIIYGLVQSSR
jgi:hypothetical protein